MQRFGLVNFGQLVCISALLVAAGTVPCFGQLDIFLTVDVTETPGGLFTYEYLLENLPGSTVGINTFVLDVGENARVTDMTAPEGWESDFNPNENPFEVAWIADPEMETFDIMPGGVGVFSLRSPLEPESLDYFIAKLLPDFTIPEGGDAAGLIEAPGLFVQPEADCNGDGVVDIFDANCTPDEQLDDFLASLDPPSLRGDADGDGEVQFSDFVILSENFGSPGEYTDADFDKDGEVQFGDFVILAESFGQSGTGGIAAAVPEPAGLASCLVGAMCLLSLLRRRNGGECRNTQC